MGLLDDAIREHLELKRRHGAAEDEVAALESQVLGEGAAAAPAEPVAPEPDATAQPVAELPDEPAGVVDEPAAPRPEPEPWLDEPDEVPAAEALDHPRPEPTGELAAADEPAEDLLEETPDFLQETPEHDRLWFEQKPPRDFDFGS